MLYYAQLNEHDICIGVSTLKDAVQTDGMVEILAADTDYIYRKYDRETGRWSEEKYEPDITAPLTEFESMQQRLQAAENAILALMLQGGLTNG